MTSELPEKMGGITETDETYVGGKRRNKHAHAVKPSAGAQDRLGPVADKMAVVSTLECGGP